MTHTDPTGRHFVGLRRFVRYTLSKSESMGDQSPESRLSPADPSLGEELGRPTREPLSPAEAAFIQELFERHRLSLYRYLTGLLHSRDEAQEILQETYMRLLRQPSFDHVRANARAYLFQVATNLARDLFRRRAAKGIDAERAVFAASGLDTPDWSSWPELALQGEQVGRLIVAALQRMEPGVRAALLLYRFRNLTHRQ